MVVTLSALEVGWIAVDEIHECHVFLIRVLSEFDLLVSSKFNSADLQQII